MMKPSVKKFFLVALAPLLTVLTGCGNSLPHEKTVTKILQEAYAKYYGEMVKLKDFSVEYDNVEEIRKGVYQASATVTFTKDLTELRRWDAKVTKGTDEAVKMLLISYVFSHKGLADQLRGEKSLTETHILHITAEYVGNQVVVQYNKNELE